MLTGCQIGCSTKSSLTSGRSEDILGRARHSVALTSTRIVPKLRAESDAYMGPGPAPANAKKGTVDVHRGGMCHLRRKYFYSQIYRDTYQFAFFLRETEPHSVLIKVRVHRIIPRNLHRDFVDEKFRA